MSTLIAVYTTRAGQTSTHWAACLAWTLAATRRVLLVDCDMEGGTLADVLLLPTDGRSIAACFGDRAASAAQLAEQAVSHPRRERLRIVPGLSRSYGYEIGDCLRTLGAALAGTPDDVVIADLGHPLSHPGLRSPRTAAQAICGLFPRAFIVIRDDPALLSRSIAVLQAAQPAHGEVILCRQRGPAYQRLARDALQQNVAGLAVRDVWSWDDARAARMTETGIPSTLDGIERALLLDARAA